MEEEFKYISSISSTVDTDPIVCSKKDAKIEDAAKEVVSIFRQRPHVKSIDFTYKGRSIRIFPSYSVKKIVEMFKTASEIENYNAMTEADLTDSEIGNYLKYGILPRYEHIKVSVASVDDEHKPTALKAETFKSADIATIAQEVIALFELKKDLKYIELIHHEEHIFVKPTYTVEDVVEIYNMQRKIQSQADKKKAEQLEEYLTSKTTNAGV